MAYAPTDRTRQYAAPAALHALGRQTRVRLAGPGGLYNIGNAAALLVGIALEIVIAGRAGGGVHGAIAATFDYLGGDTAAIALTAATAVFLWSGEAYHRAWVDGSPPDEALSRQGDVLSAIGALLLSVTLMSLGHAFLAATAGLLHAFGKFGSAWSWKPVAGWRSDWPDFYRSVVLVSRVPAVLLTVIDLARHLGGSGASPSGAVMPATLLVCYVLWAWADVLLFRTTSATEIEPT